LKRPVLERGKQGVQLGQGGAVLGFEGFNGLDSGGKGLLQGQRWYQQRKPTQLRHID
jgi:hypothetical protein